MQVALYARVSTTRQAEKDLSIPDQINQMRDWCKANGHLVVAEYIEAGASATDDRRPEFQKMISDATAATLSPYQAVIVHSRSRFFRDLFEFLSYEKKLKRAGCRVVSITQQTADDPAGEMASKMFSLFDEYASRENGKHTLRAMKENARRGFLNGSRPCYGYRAVECTMDGAKSRKKKRAEIDPTEAAIVRNIFDYYLNGHQGRTMGPQDIAKYLNQQGTLLRGALWNKSRIFDVLTNTAYIGEYYFNKHDNKTHSLKPESEWIRLNVEPIITPEVFEAVRLRRESRSPEKTPPRVVNSRNLLIGLLKCGVCGAGVTSATGKSGRYRYYKCHAKIAHGCARCNSPSVSIDKLDSSVMEALLDQVLAPSRLKVMLAEFRKHQQSRLKDQEHDLKPLQRELDQVQAGTARLFEAVEKGLLPLDESLQQRIQELKAKKEEILRGMAEFNRRQEMPIEVFSPNKLEVFSQAMRQVFLEHRDTMGKEYLRLLVKEIRLKDKQAEISGSYAALGFAVQKTKAGNLVPAFVPNWLPDLDSNQGPAD